MGNLLNVLAQHRDLILLAEIGALIHDLGKLSREFVQYYSEVNVSKTWQRDVHHEVLRSHSQCSIPVTLQPILHNPDRAHAVAIGIQEALLARGWLPTLAESVATECQARIRSNQLSMVKSQLSPTGRPYASLSGSQSDELKHVIGSILDPAGWHQRRLENEQMISTDFLPENMVQILRQVSLGFGDEITTLKDFVEMHHDDHWNLPWLVRLLKADLDGVDGFDSWIDKGNLPGTGAEQAFMGSFIATAFGHEAQQLPVGPDEDSFKLIRYSFAAALADALGQVQNRRTTLDQVRPDILKTAEAAFRQALGETRRAANDVTLWDHTFSVASLYKAALVKVILERAMVGEKYTLPAPISIGWRFLRVSVDSMAFFAQAHHVTDILGRRQVVEDALNKVRTALEVTYPLGNEVYRDEYGSVFVLPGLNKTNHGQVVYEVEQLIRETWRQTEVGAELLPALTWNDDQEPVRREMVAVVGRLLAQEPPPPAPELSAVQSWWEHPDAQHKEVCTVCGVRPIGYAVAELYGPGKERIAYYREAAAERKVCGPCLKRRGRRAQEWIRSAPERKRTIWTDEVADNNGRLALIVGQFDLRGWLDGRLVKSMLVAPGLSKNPSPARIRRCWETTRQFWLDITEGRDGRPSRLIPERPFRLLINPANPVEVGKALGDYHVYAWPLRSGVTLSVVWVPFDGQGGGYFLTADNLWYLAGPEQLGLPSEALGDPLRLLHEFGKVIRGGDVISLQEPSGYGRPGGRAAIIQLPAENALSLVPEPYVPYISILAEPATFTALMPASSAMNVLRSIENKYATEMGRVRDRLPLHLGLVVFQRATPLRAALDAGRALLSVAGREEPWEPWTVELLDSDPLRKDSPPMPGRRTVTFANGATWRVPLVMGDGEIPDQWYAHLLKVNPKELTAIVPDQNLVHASQLNVGDVVWTRPATFDYVFLDTTGRRFEVAYGSDGRRLGRTGRPFELGHIQEFHTVWQILIGDTTHPRLQSSQLHALMELLQVKAADWGTSGLATTRRLAADALRRAAWPGGWRSVPALDRQRLLAAAESGWLADVLNLYLNVLKTETTDKEVK